MTDGPNGTEDSLELLLDAIRTASGDPSLEWATPPAPVTGGFWAQIWRVDLSTSVSELRGPLVARVMPDAEVGARETAIQIHLADAGYPTPKVRLAGGPGPFIDQAWMLMDVADGKMLLDDLSGIDAIVRLPRLARTMPDTLARHAAALHRIDVAGAPPLGGATDVIETYRTIAADVDRGDLVAVADWLDENRPAGGREVICHGDLHPFNILADPSGDTVLDWSAARITDPAYDMAYTRLLLGNPALTAPKPLAPVLAAAGRWLADRFVRVYDEIADEPVDADQLQWFTVLQTLHVLAEVVEANGEVRRDPNHPFRSMHPAMTRSLQEATGLPIDEPATSG